MQTNILISIGNSDDKLTQREWAKFIIDVRETLADFSSTGDIQVHGEWFSAPDSPWQNANWCIEILDTAELILDSETSRRDLRACLIEIRNRYKQESIAWTEGAVEFI